ncbi:hypothetical protein VTO42DRAFT_8456 [Malbranchea cinnamomea]
MSCLNLFITCLGLTSLVLLGWRAWQTWREDINQWSLLFYNVNRDKTSKSDSDQPCPNSIRQTLASMGSGPHIRTMLLSGATNSSSKLSEMRPFRPVHDSEGRVNVWTIVHFSSYCAAMESSSDPQRMSTSERLPSKTTHVLSLSSCRTARST